jgi:hypothetical protein
MQLSKPPKPKATRKRLKKEILSDDFKKLKIFWKIFRTGKLSMENFPPHITNSHTYLPTTHWTLSFPAYGHTTSSINHRPIGCLGIYIYTTIDSSTHARNYPSVCFAYILCQQADWAVKPLSYIQEVWGSNLSCVIGCQTDFPWNLLFCSGECPITIFKRPRPYYFKSLRTNYSWSPHAIRRHF